MSYVVTEASLPFRITIGIPGDISAMPSASHWVGCLFGLSNGVWVRANATVGYVVRAEVILMQAGRDGDNVAACRRAILYSESGLPSPLQEIDTPSPIWLGEDSNGEPGGATSVKPTTTGDLQQAVGVTVDPDTAVIDLSGSAADLVVPAP